MAFEYYYCIDLMIVHPSLDPKLVTERITELKPRAETEVGTDIVDSRGVSRGRKAIHSVWAAPLHEAKRLYSETTPISEFISKRLDDLERHREFMHQLKDEGYVVLSIAWFSETRNSASCLDWDVIRKCADLGLGIELNFYAAPDGGVAGVDRREPPEMS